MKRTINSVGALIFGVGVLFSGCVKRLPASFHSLKNPELATKLKSFIGEKEAQAKSATNGVPSEFKAFFAVGAEGDWLAVSNAFRELRTNTGLMHDTAWQSVVETFGAIEAFGEGNEKYSTLFGTNIIASIPAGSIYFGGTDPGRFIITALQASHARGEPFFTLSQGALP